MKRNNFFVSKLKGELNMKRTLVTLALVTAFVFAFSAVAAASLPAGALPTGTNRGFTPIRTQAEVDAGYQQGFITFDEARAEMARNFGAGGFYEGAAGADLQGTAHGGYVTATTKCAVCHSAHRASGYNPEARVGDVSGSSTGDINLANVRNQSFLTAGATSCTACHTPGGAQVADLLVEWGLPNGGPHAYPGRGCSMCHNAGIHGLQTSSFNVMNVFMLGNTRSRTSTGANWPTTGDPLNRDEQIRAELGTSAETARLQRGGVLDVPVDSPSFTVNAGVTNFANATWWYDGDRSLGPAGTTPPAFGAGVTAGGTQFGAARSLATAYTCGEAGCHSTTAMFNLNWGMGFDRANKIGPSGGDVDGVNTVTGHVMPSVRTTGGANNACGPCHAGNPAGFPTASSEAGARDVSRLAYGCDQCHDMVGVATNTTAWPHGNRNILVYEWQADGTQEENMAAAGNLWMYGGNIARSTELLTAPGSAVTTAQATQNGGQSNANILAIGGGTQFRGPTSENTSFADQSWLVLTDVTSGRYGVMTAANGTALTGSGLTDGSCLKCHVALDRSSLDALGSMGADALQHAWRGGPSQPVSADLVLNPTWDGQPPNNGSGRLFLYR